MDSSQSRCLFPWRTQIDFPITDSPPPTLLVLFIHLLTLFLGNCQLRLSGLHEAFLFQLK